jgi:hypothetical protein
MPNANRVGRYRRIASSQMARVAANDTNTSAGYLARAGTFQQTMTDAAATMTGSCSR